ncbi:MAG: PAS domain-containing protein [Limisphaerales bacterium]|nr:MAG: PAS domain-containing protein [Limisphaerales bacterium]KAG0509769.1 MAG: PAS domain-containing protein [Limisphaerales bacterium]TXT51009.1 MAG: PAS domain-containing protein [Limisphaerales bacterium]
MKPLSIKTKLFGGFGLALVILAGTAFASWRSLQALIAAQELVARTESVITEVEKLLVETLDTQTGARGFVITGDEAFLKPFLSSQAALPGQVALLRRLVADNPAQAQRLAELDGLCRARLEIAGQLVQMRRERGFDNAVLSPLVQRGKETMDKIRVQVRELKREQEALRTERVAASRTRAEQTLVIILLGSAVGFGLVGLSSYKSYAEIQARQQAEAEVRRAAAEIEDLYNNAPCGYCSVDKDGRVRAMNNTELAMLGYAREEVVGKRLITELLTPASGETFRRKFPEFVSTGRIADVEFEFVRKNGSTFTGLLSATAIKDEAGHFVRSRSTTLDISARKQAEAERDRFFNISLDLLGIASAADGRFKRVSPGVTDLLGWSAEEFLARPFIEFVHPDDRVATLREVERQTVMGEKVLHFENRYQHRDGSWRVLSWRSVPQPGGLMYAIARDVTERKEMEEQLRQFNHELEQRVAERTAELSRVNEKLKTAATRLARSNRELQDFAFVASHDLQEPLRKIQAFSDRLVTKCGPALDDTGRDYLARMLNAAARMRRLIDDLLMFSRVASKARPFEPVNLATVATEVVSDLEVRLEQTAGRVEVGPLPALDADPTQMRQLLQNLIGNALKFRRPEVPPLVAVWSEQSNGHVHLNIADNGIGFDEKYAGRIFQVFQRLHGRAEYEGSGIGLAVCRKIAERHGGSITARSTPGVGSTFTITLPLRQTQPGSDHEQIT